jgi:biotin transport system substrate-specific component
MHGTAAVHSTLIGRVWPAQSAKALRAVVLVLIGTLFLTVCSQIAVWTMPVPVTMQTFAVLLIGAVYGWRLGAATVGAYLVQGAMGLPVFANMHGGIGILFGPTGGYLFGFLLAAAVVGWLAEKGWDRNVLTTALAMLLGNVLLYVPGLIWLANYTGWNDVLAFGLLPFVWVDAAKLAAAALLLPAAWRIVRR